MNKNAIDYVRNALNVAEERLLAYTQDASGAPYPLRFIVHNIEQQIKEFEGGLRERRWIIMPGLRGVGKTTALAQTYRELRKRYPAARILYVSLDVAQQVMNFSLQDLLAAYEFVLGTEFERQRTPFFLLLDEVHVDPKWGAVLKALYDKTHAGFIIATGSSAVELQVNADIARRATFHTLFPMSFTEFQMINRGIPIPHELQKKIFHEVYFSDAPAAAFAALQSLQSDVLRYDLNALDIERYLAVGTFPFGINFPHTAQVYDAINQLLEKIVRTDIAALSRFDANTLHNIKRLLFLIADADVMSLQKISTLLEMSSVTVAEIFDVLERAEVLVRAAPYGSQTSKVKKPSKYLFITPALRAALLSSGGQEHTLATRRGHYLEDITALHFYREFLARGDGSLAYDPSKGSADFILQLINGQEIAIEVGSGEKGSAQVAKTMKERGITRGMVISSRDLALSEDKSILFLPFSYFLLM